MERATTALDSKEAGLAALLLPLLLFAEQLALGVDGALLAAMAASGEILLTLFFLPMLMPDSRFWRRAWPVIALMMAILAWLAQPVVWPGFWPARARLQLVPDLALSGLVRVMGGFALLLAAGWLGYRYGMIRRALGWMIAFGTVAIIIGLVLRQIDAGSVWGLSKGLHADRFSGTMLNANAHGCLSGMLVLLATGYAMDGLGRIDPVNPRWASVACSALAAVIGLGSCAISGSRTALIATLVLAVLMVAATPIRAERKRGRAALIGLILLAIMLLVVMIGDATLDRVYRAEADITDRHMIWAHYWFAIQPALMTGYGLLSFDQLNMLAMRDPFSAANFWYIHSPHNWALRLFMTGGLPYAMLLIVLVAALLSPVSRFYAPWVVVQNGRNGNRGRPLSLGMLAAALLSVICGWTDIALDVPVVIATTTVLVAMLWGQALRRADDGDR